MLSMLGSMFGGGAGGFSGSSEAHSATGANTIGGFNFSPKANSVHPGVWVAVAALVVLLVLRR